MNDFEIAKECWELVLAFFDSNQEKTQIWFETYNPGLGATPVKLIQIGRAHILLRWIKTQLDANG